MIESNSIQFKGYCFLDNILLTTPEIQQLFLNIDFNLFCEINQNLNGVYSIIISSQNQAFLYVSPGGFHKLFYSFFNNELSISYKASDLNKFGFDPNAMLDYRASLFCWNSTTFYKNVIAVEPGWAIWINGLKEEKRKLFNYAVEDQNLLKDSKTQLQLQGGNIFDKAIDRMISFLNGRQAVVPLSGGYDSRFILTSLVLRGYRNIVAFTYGIPGVPDYENAHKTAEKLGIPWFYIEYSKENVRERIFNQDLGPFLDYMLNGNSFPCLHEIIAITRLKEDGKIEKNAVILTGHSGDFLGGSQYLKVVPNDLSTNKISNLILNTKFDASFFSKIYFKKRKEEFDQRVLKYYSVKSLPSTIFEDIDLSEKVSKHILNAAKVYEYYGYICYFLFWDKELLQFFSKVPLKLKLEKKLFDSILELYFQKLDLVFDRELNPSVVQLKIQSIKNRVRKFLPKRIKQYYSHKNDYFLYQDITQEWRIILEKKGYLLTGKDYSYNIIIANWVVYQLQNQVSFSE